MKRFFLACLTATILAACSGGGSGTPTNPADRGRNLFNGLNQYDATPSAPSLPTTGGATYKGQLGLGIQEHISKEEALIFGDLTMSVNFQSRDISGQASNLIKADDGVFTPVGGSLNLDGVTIGTNGLAVDLTGQMVLDGTTTGNLDVPFRGGFKGTSAVPDMVGGAMNTSVGFIPNTTYLIRAGAFYGRRH